MAHFNIFVNMHEPLQRACRERVGTFEGSLKEILKELDKTKE
jgi:hypothetical protein